MSNVLLPMCRRLSIVDKRIGVVKLDPNWAQTAFVEDFERQMNTRGRVRTIILKARQLGMSTVTEACLFNMCFIVPHYRGLIVTHEVPASQRLLEMTQLYWDTYPFRSVFSRPKYNSRNDLVWSDTSSGIRIATAGKKGSEGVGRSNTIHFLHASEVAFWDNPEGIMLGLTQAIPDAAEGTAIVLESTANGIGNFFEQTWKKATAGENEYVPLFFPWISHYEYRASAIGIPHYNLGALDDEERTLQAIGVDDDQLAWRRWMIVNKCNSDPLQFAQEYPATPEQAFIATGTNVFHYPLLYAAYEPEPGVKGRLLRDGQHVTFEHDPTGPLTLYRQPDTGTWGDYIVAGDPTHTTRGDYAVAQVLNRRTLEQVAVYRAKVEPMSFGQELFKLGVFYNTALVSSEAEGPSSAAIGQLHALNYPRLYRRARPDATPGKQRGDIWGWMTTRQSKAFMVGVVKKYLVDRSITIHDSETFSEMKDYVIRDGGEMGPADEENGHDDTVMALAQACACNFQEGPILPYGGETTDPPTWTQWEVS